MSCELTQSVLHGYIDGELDAVRAADFERHLPSCPECVAALEAQEKLRASIHHLDLYERAPAAFRRNLYANLGMRPTTNASVSTAAFSWPSTLRWLTFATAALVLAFLSVRFLPELRHTQTEDHYVASIVDAHLRSLQPGHLDDIISTDQHTVKPWFDGKIDFAPPVQDFASDGFPLQGGRLDVVHGRTVAVLVYGRRKHLINVFIWPSTQPETSRKLGSQLGYQWIGWRKNGLELWAISDVSSADLDALQHLLTE